MVEGLVYNIGGTPSYHVDLDSVRPRKNLARILWFEFKENNASLVIGIYGKTGSGKSTYAMKIAYEFYRDWDKVLKYMVFTPFDFQEAIDYLHKNNEWIPILVWDDAGPWMELMKRTSWHPLSLGVRGALETMRLYVGALILTMTNERSLPRTILYNGNLYKYRVRTIRWGHHRSGKQKSMAEIQVRKEYRSEWGKYYWDTSEIYRDYFLLGTPNYSEYEELRRNYIMLYNKLIMASREIGPSKIMDYIYEEWKKLKKQMKWRAFYEE